MTDGCPFCSGDSGQPGQFSYDRSCVLRAAPPRPGGGAEARNGGPPRAAPRHDADADTLSQAYAAAMERARAWTTL